MIIYNEWTEIYRKDICDLNMTINDVARLAGVSVSTVSKIVNGKDANISEATRTKVLSVVKEYNYSPYKTILNAYSSKTYTLALLMNSCRGSSIVDGVISAAQTNKYGVLVYYSNNDPDMELKHIHSICSRNIDGVIWAPVSIDSIENNHFFAEAKLCVEYMNCNELDDAWNFDYLSIGRYLTQQLIDLGHTRVACTVNANDLSGVSKMMAEGFRQCVLDNNLQFSQKMLITGDASDILREVIGNSFTGLICPSISSAASFYRLAGISNYSIPGNCSLISLCDVSATMYRDFTGDPPERPDISCLLAPYFEFGAAICTYLIDRCEKKTTDGRLFSFDYALSDDSTLSIPITKSKKGFVVVGSINMDTTINVSELPQSGKSIMAFTSMQALGGKGANQAVGISKLNRQVSLIGKIGNDIDSSLVLDKLIEYSVSTVGVYHDIDSASGKAYIHLQSDGESTITVLAGANSKLTGDEVVSHSNAITNACYCLLNTESPVDAVTEAAKIAREAGVKTILKPAGVNSVPDELISSIDIFVPNQMEANMLCPDRVSPEGQAAYFLKKGVGNVIITLGSNGCFLKNEKTERYFSASSFVSVDNTGAADAFISALAVYLSENYPIESAISIATYAAGFCVSRYGVTSALADRTELEKYILLHDAEALNVK